VKSLANEAYALALKDTLDGMAHSFPCIRNALFFDERGDIVAVDEKTPEDAAVRTVDALDEMLNKAGLLDNLENAVFEGAKGWLNVSRFDDLFLVTVASAKTDLDRANAFANALVPAVLRVLRRVNLAPVKESLEELEVENEQPLAHDSKEESDEPVEETRIEEHSDKERRPSLFCPSLRSISSSSKTSGDCSLLQRRSGLMTTFCPNGKKCMMTERSKRSR
jgi:hypothetical protein